MKDDYLKYWRVIRYFVRAKYNLTQADLELMLFLRSEGYFDKDTFHKFNELLSWNTSRFARLLKDDWIKIIRKRSGPTKEVYSLTFKANRMLTSIYKKLSGEEIPTTQANNPMYAKNVKYSDKVYRNFIRDTMKTTNAIKRQQRLSPE